MPPHSACFQCKHVGCNAVYQRKEHLTRHMARHDQPQRCSCPYCDSTLARSDLLRRHIRTYHPQEKPPPSRAQRACRGCHARKERCDGEYPCSRCQRRRVTCSRIAPQDAAASNEQIASPNAVPETSQWVGQEYLDIYFDKFHQIWPILHRATFKPPKEPCILLQSMIMIGLWIKGDQASQDRAITFHRKLLAAIQAQRSQWYVSELTARQNSYIPWPIATYQSILLQLIFALLVAQKENTLDLNFRFQLPVPKYELLTALVESCRRLGLFHYPNMLTQHTFSAPIALVWVSVEELKRFGLALYKLCRLCSQHCQPTKAVKGDSGTGTGLRNKLLTLADLDFCMPDSDEIWNTPPGTGPESVRIPALQQTSRDSRDSDNWISRTSAQLYDTHVNFDWI
ncbi:hypothetical protein BDV59DRAFT_176962 [Aspergillus ambiguus]|uniref:Zn(II)2Cys6 transcription factor n=1 Tax=Aspergillus ambiguus TaxID=176160 RepID=UPI003CCE3A20